MSGDNRPFTHLLIALAFMPTPLLAASGVIEEIVVTARQRAESLQDTPVTITAVSDETIERLALNNLDQISDIVPNLLVSYGSSGGSATVSLRGIGTGSSSAGFSSAVGLLIDDVHFERGRWVQGGMVDLQQVEVLKGPQALYYGKNNTSGLIILRTRDPVPGAETEANFKVGYEFDAGEYLAEAGVSASLSDTFAIRLAGRLTEQTDGWITNNAGPLPGSADPNLGYAIPGNAGTKNLPELKDKMARLTAVWTPNEQFTAKFKSSITSTEDNGLIYHDQLSRCFGPGGRPLPVFGVEAPFDDCKANYTRSKSNTPPGMMAGEPSEFGDGTTYTDYDAWRTSLRLDYEFENLTLTSVTGFAHYDSDALENATFAGDAQVPFWENTDHDSFSQELRIQTRFDGPLNFLGGVLYSDKDLFFRNSARIAALGPDSRNGRQWTWDKVANQESESWSVYGELVWDITDTVELSGGARYTDEERDFVFTVPHLHELFDVFLPGILSSQTLEGVFKDDDTSPQVTLSWSPQDNVTLFGAYREGFKSGGFDASHTLAPGPADQVIQDIRFESEKADGFEFGIKSRWLDGSLQLNATAYFFDYDDLQLSTLDTESTQFRIQNVAAASTEGVEAELTWAAREDLTLRAFVNLNEARYDQFQTSCFAGQTIEQGCDQAFSATTGRFGAQDVDGDKVPGAPDWYASLGFTYDLDLGGSGWRGSFDLDGRYLGSRSGSLQRMPDSKLGDYVILDASFRLYSADEHWEFTLIGRNVTDKLVILGYSDRPLVGSGNGLPAGSPGIQRADSVSRVLRGAQWWLQASYRM
ncbi:MAG: TonB-dependent receptor [Gammaproteobacteria bacterium]|nr:TonB-dependent receptor [Gammaproteobacteria bacterium]